MGLFLYELEVVSFIFYFALFIVLAEAQVIKLEIKKSDRGCSKVGVEVGLGGSVEEIKSIETEVEAGV